MMDLNSNISLKVENQIYLYKNTVKLITLNRKYKI